MAHKNLVVALGMIVAASPLSAAILDAPPPGSPATEYCLRVEPIVGSRIETIQCATRDQWAARDIDVDQEWAENGVRVVG